MGKKYSKSKGAKDNEEIVSFEEQKEREFLMYLRKNKVPIGMNLSNKCITSTIIN